MPVTPYHLDLCNVLASKSQSQLMSRYKGKSTRLLDVDQMSSLLTRKTSIVNATR